MLNAKMPNRLLNEKSPYLLQHAYNPVHWYPWGEEAFETAQAKDKPIFLSIGYSTCHWCHVMEHESFEDEQVAETLNRDFISIKVDREERPDIDAVYMAVCQALTGSGGWPLTILMTPEQKPFYAATYLPKSSHYGMAGMLELLPEITRQWKTSRKKLMDAGDEISMFLRKQADASAGSEEPTKDLIDRAARLFESNFDAMDGGFGAAPKFPTPHNLLFLLRYSVLERNSKAQKMAEKTLKQMYRGGIFDHIGGGFSRYSTDSRWLVPHFEKMLYDNALLALTYLEAYQMTRRPLYGKVARQILDYVLRELTDDSGGFFCGQDADSEGVEGKYYVFTPEEVEHVLGKPDAERFCRWFDISEAGNFEEKSIPNLLSNVEYEMENTEIEDFCRKIYSYRLQRTSLHKDDKILTSWNALMIAAFAKAGCVLEDACYLQAAEHASQFIAEHLIRPDGRLLVRWRDGDAAHEGKLDDYAFYAFALLELYLATFDPRNLQKAVCVAEQMLTLFFDASNGGFYLYASDSEQLISRPKELYDGAIPSGNSVATLVLGRLYKLTGEPKWQDASVTQLRFIAGSIRQYPAGYSFSLLAMLESLYSSKELICVSAEDAVPLELHNLLSKYINPNLTVLVKTPGNETILSDAAPFTKDYPIPETGVAYYLCRNGTCAAPVFDIIDLCDMLTEK